MPWSVSVPTLCCLNGWCSNPVEVWGWGGAGPHVFCSPSSGARGQECGGAGGRLPHRLLHGRPGRSRTMPTRVLQGITVEGRREQRVFGYKEILDDDCFFGGV